MGRRLRTLNELQDRLDGEMAWRIREIADTKHAVSKGNELRAKALLRAGVALLYAHWEGFVKQGARAYIDFVESRRLPYGRLIDSFIAAGVKRHISELVESRTPVIGIQAVNFLMERLDDRARIAYPGVVNAGANLNSDRFEQILLSLGLQVDPYTSRFHFIDESLLRRRNSIAHGDYIDLDKDDYSDLSDRVIEMMRWFKDDIENAASLKTYLR